MVLHDTEGEEMGNAMAELSTRAQEEGGLLPQVRLLTPRGRDVACWTKNLLKHDGGFNVLVFLRFFTQDGFAAL